jgi:hypothetical protein
MTRIKQSVSAAIRQIRAIRGRHLVFSAKPVRHSAASFLTLDHGKNKKSSKFCHKSIDMKPGFRYKQQHRQQH